MVIPAHDEGNHIKDTIETLPDFIDKIYVVDDGSVHGKAFGGKCLPKDLKAFISFAEKYQKIRLIKAVDEINEKRKKKYGIIKSCRNPINFYHAETMYEPCLYLDT